LPTNSNGDLDLTAMIKMSNVQKLLDENRITDPATKRRYWEHNGFEYDEEKDTGKPKGNFELRRFIIQTAYTSEDTASFNDPAVFWETSILSKNPQFFEKVPDSMLKQFIDEYDSTAGKGQKLD
jgi:hypothetical protein